MAHLKRLLAPSFWKVSKKESTWIVTPSPGAHQKFSSIPAAILVKNILKIVNTTSEARKIIKKGEILVDGKRRKDHGYSIGLFDVVSIPKLGKQYRLVPTKKGLEVMEITANEAKMKICKIKNKTSLKEDKVQLNLHDGKNITTENGNYKTGDSLLLELPSLKVVEHLPLEKGSVGMVSRGADAGKVAKVKDFIKGNMREEQKVVCVIDKEDRIIGKKNFIVVGKDKPVIKVGM